MGHTTEKTIQEKARAQVLATLKFLHPPGGVFEIAIYAPKQASSKFWEGRAFGKDPMVAGWFKDPGKAAALATEIQARAIYTTLNPCLPALLGRANERLKANVARTQDKEITHLRNLLIDIDPIRPTGISSSLEEHEAALVMVREILEDLAQEGWPRPLVADSGNGGHLIYSLEMENAPENVELLKAVLTSLAWRYEPRLKGLGLELDQKVFNPARISKLYGTVAGKGENLPERPHRRAQILNLPPERAPVPLKLLEKIAGEAPEGKGVQAEKPAPPGAADTAGQQKLDVAAYLAAYGKEVVKVKEHGSSTLYCLAQCVFDPSHYGNEAAVGQAADGKLFYQCFHNSCKGRSWAEARMIISGQDKLTPFMPEGEKRQRKNKAKPAQAAPGKPGPPITEEFSWSDLGNARRLVAKHGRDLRYGHLNKEWYYWNGKVWQVDNCGEAVRRAKQTINEIYQEGLDLDWDSGRRKNLFKFALKSESSARIQGMLALAQSEPGIPILPEEFDADPMLFNVQNGVVDLETAELQPHRREDLITCISPVFYDLEAPCPYFNKFITEIFDGNRNIVDFMLASLGYALTGDTREQCFWILWGSGANGKGTLLDCISDIFGSYRANISTETLLVQNNNSTQIRSDVARLDGPRLVTAAEIDRGRKLSESLVKGLSGKDTITARFLYGKDFEFLPRFKLFVQTNNKPIIKDQTNAMWRRLKLVEFPMDFRRNPDKELDQKLATEREGIFHLLLKGCLHWQAYGLGEPPEIIEAVEEYRAEMNPLKEFIEDKCLLGEGYTTPVNDLYEAYKNWAEDNLQKKERLTKKSFGMSLGEQGFKPGRTGAVRFRRGLALRTIE